MSTWGTPLVIGNWKMNLNHESALKLAGDCASLASNVDKVVDVGIAVPAIWLAEVGVRCRESPLVVAAQDVSTHESGAHTGEISATMVSEFGRAALVGHSERRQNHHESIDETRLKVAQLHARRLLPILCVGETREERATGRAHAIVEAQMVGALPEGLNAPIVIAYEPVWAIGTGESAAPSDAQEMAATIREILARIGEARGMYTRILYGGSVSATNAGSYLSQPDIDGALVGGASLRIEEFTAIVGAAIGTS